MTGQSRFLTARSLVFELLAVFLGVVLAFLAEDWRESRVERREERTLLVSLRDEIRSNQDQMEHRLSLQDRTRSHTQAFLGLLGSADDGASVVVPDSLLIAFVTTATYDPARGTIDAILGGGQLPLIDDAELRTQIAAWPAAFENAHSLQLLQRDVVQSVIGPALAAAGVDLGQHWPANTPFFQGTIPEEMRDTSTPVPATAEVRSLVGQRFQIVRLVWANPRMLSDFDLQLLELVNRRLGSG
jgi:hypothetical protein